MAALIPRLDFRNWNYSDLAFGLHAGLVLNRVWVSTIHSNNKTYRSSPDGFLQEIPLYIPFIMTLSKAIKLKASIPFIQNHSTAISWGILSVAALNISALSWRKVSHKNLSDVRTTFDKLLIVAWKMTPYLALVTNIALLIFETKIHPQKASAALFITGISLLDLTPWMSRSFGWYMNVGIRLPIDMAAFYYASNRNRWRIVGNLMHVPEIQRYLQAGAIRVKRSFQSSRNEH